MSSVHTLKYFVSPVHTLKYFLSSVHTLKYFVSPVHTLKYFYPLFILWNILHPLFILWNILYPRFIVWNILLARLRPLALFFCQINTLKTKWKYCSVHASRFRKEHYILEGFQASPVCPTRKNNRVDEDEYAAFVERYWQKVTEVLGEKPVLVPLYRPRFSTCTGLGSNLCIRIEMPATISMSPSMVRDRVRPVLHLKG